MTSQINEISVYIDVPILYYILILLHILLFFLVLSAHLFLVQINFKILTPWN